MCRWFLVREILSLFQLVVQRKETDRNCLEENTTLGRIHLSGGTKKKGDSDPPKSREGKKRKCRKEGTDEVILHQWEEEREEEQGKRNRRTETLREVEREKEEISSKESRNRMEQWNLKKEKDWLVHHWSIWTVRCCNKMYERLKGKAINTQGR